MKRILLLFLLLLGAVGAEAQVRFMTRSTDGVRRQAVEQNKLVFIDLFATWCPPCQMMEREVFSRSDVGAFMEQHFVCAKYDIDKTTGRELLKRYGNRRVPLWWLLRPFMRPFRVICAPGWLCLRLFCCICFFTDFKRSS